MGHASPSRSPAAQPCSVATQVERWAHGCHLTGPRPCSRLWRAVPWTQLCVRRKAHGITLTPTGTSVLRRARALLRQAADLEAEARDDTDELSGALPVGCYLTIAPTVLPRVLRGFGEVHPRVTIDFREGTQDALQQQLLDGELDLAVLYELDVLPEIDRVELSACGPTSLTPEAT
jgi:DNA-binding transcriptional LysR family regulator